MKKIISAILGITLLCFGVYTIKQYQHHSYWKERSHLIVQAIFEKNEPYLLEIEKQLYQEIKTGSKESILLRNYAMVLLNSKMYEKYLDVFNDDRLSDDNIKNVISFSVCSIRYKLNQNGKECAEEIFNYLRQKPNYYNDRMYWQFAVLADKQNEMDNVDISRSNLDKDVLEMLMSAKKEMWIENF